MEKESRSKKKGCLPGCLLVFIIIIVFLAVLAVVGYLNRHAILPFITDKLGVEVSSVIHHVGTKAETGMPPEFLENAYKIDMPQGDKTVKVTTSDTPADQTYDAFIQYFKQEGWEVEEEMAALEMAPEQIESISGYMEEEIRVAELARNSRQMGLAVTRYNEETVAAVWHTPGAAAAEAGSEPARSEPEKTDEVKKQPEEVSGSDPEDVPVYPGAVRTAYQKVEKNGSVSHAASYAAKADKEKVLTFYETQMEENDWEIVKKAETSEEKYLEATKTENQVRIIIRPSNDYAGYTEVEMAAKYPEKQ
ncbi:MAG: hypothetical protein K9K82_13220 [Desulfobacteraceae bacterium]|nr:hypothetical protein [Desulfobacteraceae bacterium]